MGDVAIYLELLDRMAVRLADLVTFPKQCAGTRFGKMAMIGVSMSVHGRLRGGPGYAFAFLLLAGAFQSPALAQSKAAAQPETVPAVMLSDLHLDPFHDPAKVPLLMKTPVEQWEAILKSADSPTQEADFAAVQEACKGKQSFDSPYALLNSALRAAKAQAPGANFVVVSGDLLVHELDCRYRAALKLPKAKGDDQSLSAAFAEKTTVFVMKQVESVFAGIPVYLALGNNDSRCNHNRLDVHDAYLKATVQPVIDGLVGIGAAERKQAVSTYESAGYYAVTMAAPMEKTRLLVVDDIYMMSKFATCEADESDHAGADEQMAWLNRELDGARQRGEHVWVLGHLPPTVNAKSALTMGSALCSKGNAEPFLSSDDLTNAITAHADVMRLAIFGHTHLDELHVIGDKGSVVPVKVVGSISPVDGNTPSFVVAKVAPASATLVDYAVYDASNRAGIGTTWTKKYDFKETYHEPNFSAKSLDELIGRFKADSAGSTAESLAYQRNYLNGFPINQMGPYWQSFACSLDHSTAAGFKACVCGVK
jgi:sphingomyelin phosphodiesterase acid-like 3